MTTKKTEQVTLEDTGTQVTLEDTESTTDNAENAQASEAPVSEAGMEAQLAKQEKTLKQRLDEMDKVKLTIPEDPNNPDDVVPIGWNGIIYAVPRGIEFDVPVVIRDIWQESSSKTAAVNRRIRESVTKEIKVT